MERKITKRLVLMGIFSMLVTVMLCLCAFCTALEQQAESELRTAAGILSASYGQDAETFRQESVPGGDLRVSLIQSDGAVVFDSVSAAPAENHLSRPEVQQALSAGEGTARRHSVTTMRTSCYYALRLEDGNILRVSMEVSGWGALLRSTLPAILLCCILVVVASVLVSLLLTRSLVRSIVNMAESFDEPDSAPPYPELKPFADAIHKDRAARQEAENMRREFTANVSHELKTPLTSISGYAELIETGMAQPEDISRFARKIHKEALRLLHLVNDILQLSRLDTAETVRQNRMEPELIDLKDIVSICVENLTVNAQRSFVTLLYEQESTPVLGSRADILDLCTNLCDNAIRYNKPGGKVTVSCGTMEGGRPYLRVVDNGIGISEEEQSRVFERFYRVDKSRSKETGGTGLGLAIVKHIAMLHGAQIDLKSHVGEGTDICVIFKPTWKS